MAELGDKIRAVLDEELGQIRRERDALRSECSRLCYSLRKATTALEALVGKGRLITVAPVPVEAATTTVIGAPRPRDLPHPADDLPLVTDRHPACARMPWCSPRMPQPYAHQDGCPLSGRTARGDRG